MVPVASTVPPISAEDLPLERVYRWEKERSTFVFLTQPIRGQVREWTWAETLSEARHMAAWLKAQNWEEGSRVAILSKNCAWWIMADLAIWMAGYVSVPIYPSLTAQTVCHLLEHSGARACFVGAVDEKEATRTGIPARIACIRLPTAAPDDSPCWDDLVADTPPLAGCPVRAADSLATIIYTSGTTGAPKGVMHSFGAFGFFTNAAARLVGLSAEERLLSYLPLAHIFERCAVEMLGFYLGFRIFFTEGLDTFLLDLGRARPTLFHSVPRLFLKFQQGVFHKFPRRRLERLLGVPLLSGYLKRRILRQLGLDRVRYLVSGAAPLPAELLLWYHSIGLPLLEGFGMTEVLLTHVPTVADARAGWLGKPLAGVETKLDESDELLIRSPMNMLGYYRDPAGTQNSFTRERFFRTGDVARVDADFRLQLIGRLKEQFKTSKGKYVAPAPIEARLSSDPAIDACCVVGAGLPSPFALIVLSEEARARCADGTARQALEDFLARRLAELNAELNPHERVAFIAIVRGPWTVANESVTPTLKIKRNTLEQRYQPLIETWRAQNTPVVWEPDDDR